MPCFKPLNAWQSKKLKPDTGKAHIMFQAPTTSQHAWNHINVPCGRCIGCRLERSRQWAIRCMHEAQMHEENCFITLTFSDDHLDPSGSLDKSDFQKFMKRLRKRFKDKKIRYLHAGEYGEITGRPHHHAILFGIDFPDKEYLRDTKTGHKVWTSQILQEIWSDTDRDSPFYGEPLGLHEIGDVTFESAAYVARYCCKKLNEPNPLITKDKYDEYGRIKEYNTMSRRPGIGLDWLKKYGKTDIWNKDTVVVRGVECKPPKYYSQQYELTNPEEYVILKENRLDRAKQNPDNHWTRLPAREKVKLEKFKELKRSL